MIDPRTNTRPRYLLRIVFGAFLVCALGAVFAFVLTRKTPPAKSAPIQARLELASGEVLVDSGGGEQRAVSGTALLSDAKIRTDKGARALVRLPDGSSIFLRGDSAVKLAAESVSLEQGEYFLDAPPSERKPFAHLIQDVSVSAADSGLSLRREADGAIAYVARGMAILSAKGGRVEVKAGEQATVKGGEAPRVAPLAFWDDWTGGMADAASGRGLPGAGGGTIYGVDEGAPSGSAARRLEIARQAVRATVREGLSETEVDQTFFNPGERPVEGWYWFTVPERATITGFAVETDGALVSGEFIEKKEAAAQYAAAKSSGHSPAILEWIDASTYRARIYPVPAGGSRRVVTRYIEMRPIVDNKLEYLYPMGSGEPVRIGEFSLSVNLGDAGTRMKIATLADARIEDNGKRITMRRSGYTPRAPFQLEAKLPGNREPLTLARYSPGGDSADYILARYTPDVDWSAVKQQRADVVVVVDTSAGGDEAVRQLKAATAEAILRALSDGDNFALVSLDVRPTVLHPQKGLAPASDKEIARALEALADHSAGGATDLASFFDVALGRLHNMEQAAVVYVGDGIPTSGEMTGEQLVERLRRALSASRSRLFTVAVGMDADHALLSELARAGGGSSFRIDDNEQTTARSLELASAVKVPTITDLEVDLGAGLDEPFTTATGKLSRGTEVAILARTHHDIPSKVKVRGRLAGEAFERQYDVKSDKTVMQAFVPKLWAAEYVRRLLGGAQGADAERGRIVALGVEYGLMTPFTSILALESEAAYSRMGIPRNNSPLRGERLGALDANAESRLAQTLAAAAWPAVGTAMGCNSEPASERVPVTERQAEQVTAAPPPLPAATAAPAAPEAIPEEPAEAPKAEAPRRAAADEDQKRFASASKGGGGRVVGAPEPLPAPQVARAPAAARRLAKPAGPRGGDGLEQKKKEAEDDRPSSSVASGGPAEGKPTSGWTAPPQLSTCSDASARPLAQRVLVWRKRIKTAGTSPQALLERYESARSACEVSDWLAERIFLDLMQRQVDNAASVEVMLRHFAARSEVQKFLAKLVLRRAVDVAMVTSVEKLLFGSAVAWNEVDLELQAIEDPEKRLTKLREYAARAPADPNGGIRLVRLLIAGNHRDEALALGTRLRDQGFVTPHIARQLGDVLARAKLDAEAVRTYSEIVEFDPESLPSRRLLGDIYLGHGWYEPAYRQYRTITDAAPQDALGWLRLAAAAAGTGRVDEALRVERKVASAQGTPGPSDPRRWARLASAARLGRLIGRPPSAPGAAKIPAESLKRELKELQLFGGPSTLVVLTWEELDADVALATRVEGREVALGEATDAAGVGLASVLLSTPDAQRSQFAARLRNLPRDHTLKLIRHDISWDGRDFKVTVSDRELATKATESVL